MQRLASVGVIAAAAISLAACSNGQTGATGSSTTTGGASTSSSAPSSSSSSSAAGNGVTTAKDVFGPACSKLPSGSAKGGLKAMTNEPVGTAASTNPLLTKLTAAAKAAGLVPTLNSSSAQYTVFAPADAAFKALPSATLKKLLSPAGKAQLTKILEYHVLGQRMDKTGLESAKTVTPLAKGTLTIGGSGSSMTVTDGQGNVAKVLCGNIPTANATVFVIDKVLMQKK
ncbi:MAG: fasciclin domain-containing protein [Sciscionella sp.]